MFDLVHELGGMTVTEFLNRTTSEELTHWMAWAKRRAQAQREAQMEARAVSNMHKGAYG